MTRLIYVVSTHPSLCDGWGTQSCGGVKTALLCRGFDLGFGLIPLQLDVVEQAGGPGAVDGEDGKAADKQGDAGDDGQNTAREACKDEEPGAGFTKNSLHLDLDARG